jgi:hypothetical protein
MCKFQDKKDFTYKPQKMGVLVNMSHTKKI